MSPSSPMLLAGTVAVLFAGAAAGRNETAAAPDEAATAVVPAPAVPTAADAEADFAAAEQLYEDGEYEQATLRLQRAARAGTTRAGADQARIHVLLGLCFLQTLDDTAAASHFEAALVTDPAAALPDYAPPRALEVFAQTRERLAAPSPALRQEPQQQPPPPSAIASWHAPAGVALLGVGALAVVGSVASFIAAGVSATTARDPDAFQTEARAAADAANAEIGVGAGLLFLGVASAAVGLGVFTLPSEDGPVRDQTPALTARSSSP